MRDAAVDQPEDCGDDDRAQRNRDFADRGDASIKQNHGKSHDAGRNGLLRRRREQGGRRARRVCPVAQISGVVRETQRARGDAERSLEERLPDIEERHQPAPALRAIGFAQEDVAAARMRNSRAQFRPDTTVEEREQGARQPGDQALRSAHRLHHERNHHERPDAHHESDVEGGRFEQPEAAFEVFGLSGCRRHGRRQSITRKLSRTYAGRRRCFFVRALLRPICDNIDAR